MSAWATAPRRSQNYSPHWAADDESIALLIDADFRIQGIAISLAYLRLRHLGFFKAV